MTVLATRLRFAVRKNLGVPKRVQPPVLTGELFPQHVPTAHKRSIVFRDSGTEPSGRQRELLFFKPKSHGLCACHGVSGRFFFNVMASLAQMEREVMVANVEAGLRRRGNKAGSAAASA